MSGRKDSVKTVAIIGVGIQGSMIAFRNAIYGKTVIGYSRRPESIKTCQNKIRKWLDYYIELGRLTSEEADAAEGRISYASSVQEACEEADLVIEAVPENLELKQEMFKLFDEASPERTYLSSNTSSLLMSEICELVSEERKEKTYQVDHDDPVRNDYLEMMWNRFTSEETKEAAKAHYETLAFDPIITERENKGYSINRVWRAVKKECLHLWANGYITPADFDRGWKSEWHNEIGPFQLMDLIGLDTIYDIEMSYYNASKDESDYPPQALKDMIDSGKLGLKSGEGFYSGYDTEAGNLVTKAKD